MTRSPATVGCSAAGYLVPAEPPVCRLFDHQHRGHTDRPAFPPRRRPPCAIEWHVMDVRASDAERDATVNHLREAAAQGRLTLEELTDRIQAAGNAVMRSDLV